MVDRPFWQAADWLRQAEWILDSYAHFLGQPLLPRTGDRHRDAEALFYLDAVVVSHGTQPDPVLNYGNRQALDLWELDAEQFIATPSRFTAEKLERAERQRLLERTARDGYVDDYSGIRITGTGRRFRIDGAIVWNLIDADRKRVGQAATFSHWKFV